MDPRMLPPRPNHSAPRIEILENPKQRGMRFRYECEGRSAGSIPGERTTSDRKTWPSIRITNYSGEVTVRVSLVSKDPIPRPHPHSLVGRDCNNGICSVRVNQDTQMTATFSNLGIQCVKRKEVAEALRLRHSLNVDPFHSHQSSDPQAVDIDLNIVRLCFEGFINQGNSHLVLQPVLSNPIFDKKATCSAMLRICRVDRSYGGCKGGDEVYLLCDKVQKDDISICFYEKETSWEAYGEFSPTDVHRQVAIVFRTPAYRDPNITEATKVHFLLKRTSDGQTSDAKDFTYLPSQHVQPQMRLNPEPMKRKLCGEAKQHVRQLIIERNIQQPKVPKQDPNQITGSSFPTLTFPDAVCSMGPTRSGFTDSALDNFLTKFPVAQFPEMKVPRMNPPQYPPSIPPNYWQRQMADNQSSFVPATSQTSFASTATQPIFVSPGSEQSFASAASPPSFTPSATPPTFTPVGAQSNYTPALTSAMAMSPMSGQQSMMTSMTHPPPSYMLPMTNATTTPMPSSSTMQQGTIPPSSVPTPDLTDLGAVGEDINLESINTASFADIDLDKGMNNLSIEPDTNFSDLIKTEPSSNTGIGYPNTILPQHYHNEQPPIVDIQAPSPQFQQAMSPVQYHGNLTTLSLLPSLDQPQEAGLPSFDLNDGLPSATQNDFDEFVRGQN